MNGRTLHLVWTLVRSQVAMGPATAMLGIFNTVVDRREVDVFRTKYKVQMLCTKYGACACICMYLYVCTKSEYPVQYRAEIIP